MRSTLGPALRSVLWASLGSLYLECLEKKLHEKRHEDKDEDIAYDEAYQERAEEHGKKRYLRSMGCRVQICHEDHHKGNDRRINKI